MITCHQKNISLGKAIKPWHTVCRKDIIRHYVGKTCCSVARLVAEGRADVCYLRKLRQKQAQKKKVTVANFSCNVCRNKIAISLFVQEKLKGRVLEAKAKLHRGRPHKYCRYIMVETMPILRPHWTLSRRLSQRCTPYWIVPSGFFWERCNPDLCCNLWFQSQFWSVWIWFDAFSKSF